MLIYEQYFRLKGPPFQPASPDGAVYFSPTHLAGLGTLESGLSGELSGLTLLTGEAGTGKTTLIYSMLQRDYKRVRIAHIDDPKLSFLEILRLILTQLNLYSPGSTKLDYLNVLDHLLELHGKEERIAIVIDEAQVLSDDILEELRLLSNRGQRDDRCLQLILVGQPELAERLKKPELRQLNQRISSRGVLKPLTTDQGIQYVECRLVAQGSKCTAIFAPHALECLLRRSDGIPRKINMLCHSAMLATYQTGEKKVSYRIAKKTAAEYHDVVGMTPRRSRAWPLVIPPLAVGTALASLLLLGFVYPNVWSDWVLNHAVSFAGAIEHKVRPVQPDETVDQPGPREVRRASRRTPQALRSPVELRASLAPGAVALAAPKSADAAPPTAPETRIVPAWPAAAALSAGPQKETAVPVAPQQRSQTTVRYGDTLEKIALRYFGSTSGIHQLIQANPQLTDINQLFVGQVIYLPPGIGAKTSHDQTSGITLKASHDQTARIAVKAPQTTGVAVKASHDQTATAPPVRNADDSPE
jgi:type II secretory pathway predicted ATPase ExeA/phage tail protein X